MTTNRAIPIINNPAPYIDGLIIKNDPAVTLLNATNKVLYVEAGSTRDSTNTYDMVLPSEIALNGLAVGINGLDTGTIAANLMYNIFLISDPVNANPTGVMASLATTPLMPFGYSAYKQIGFWSTSVANGANWDLGYITGISSKRIFNYQDNQLSTLTGGVIGVTTPVNVSFLTRVPVIENLICNISVQCIALAGDSIILRLFGSDPLSTFSTFYMQGTTLISFFTNIISKLNVTVPTIVLTSDNGNAQISVVIQSYEFDL